MAEYASQIKCIQEKGLSYSGNIPLTATHPAISPLLTTTWDQGDPYNQNCPDFFTYGKCVTGCVATAMAQLMYYHRANSVTATTATIPAYDCKKNWTSSGETLGHIHVNAIPAGSLIDWDNMLDYYTGGESTVQREAVANLMLYCGVSVEMDYSNIGSGASSEEVPIALKVYFNYSNNTELKNRSDYSSDEEWDNLIYNELRNSRPVFYRGSNNSSAHAFVCDGYDGQGYYHINWGWSGTSDGFFLLSALDPNEQGTGGSSAGYNNNQAALINAEPSNTIPSTDNGIEFVDAMVKYLCIQNWDTNGDGGLSEEEAAAVTDLGYVFKGSTITSFNELQYFTGLKTIRSWAFSGCSNLTSITIPCGVTNIDSYTFDDCRGLTTITIPASITSIGYSAFNGCSGLTSITIPNSVTSIGNSAFNGCSGLTSITIPNSVTSIGNYAFRNCSGLSTISVNSSNTVYDSRDNCNAIINKASNSLIVGCKNTIIPSTVTRIDNNAFYGCKGLTSITIPSSVMSIGDCAFDGCKGLTSITIPSSVMSIGDYAFRYCSGLTAINVNSSNTNYDSRNNCNAIIRKTSNSLIVGCKNTIIPSTVTSIGDYAFSNCSDLTSITIPIGVTSIGDRAFSSCSGLSSITIPRGVTIIGENAFSGCSGLTSITIPSSVTSIGERAFSSCSKLASMSVKWNEPLSIEEKVFYSSNINNAILYVPIGTKSAYQNASYWKEFNQIVEQNTPISNITFADANVKAICVQNWDTNGDGELSESEAETVTDLGSVFKNSTITLFNELLYFTGLKTIGSNAFSDCNSLSSIMIPNNVTSIKSNAFNNCSGLNSITIPSSVTSISDGVFRNCSGLTAISVNSNNTVYDSRNNCNAIIEKASNKLIAGCKKTTIPSTVTSIGSYAFYGCSGLTWITISNGVTSIGSYAFYGCSGLTWITIPNGVTSIGSYAFYGCSGLTSITIPSGVTSIDSYAFYDCSGLTSITISRGVTSIGSYAFSSCSGLTSITIPSGVTSIGSYAFSGCSGLTSITIPSRVTSIASYAFSSCSKLASVSVKWNEPLSIEENVFLSSNINNAILYVPIGTKSAYQNASYWKEFKQIVEQNTPSSIITFDDSFVEWLCVQNWDTNGDYKLSESEAETVTDLSTVFNNNTDITSFNELQYFTGLKTIGYAAFMECDALTSIAIPVGVTSIEESAFSNCGALTSVIIPDGVTTIGNYAFCDCNDLSSITIPNSVTSIGDWAFINCYRLPSVTFGKSVTSIGDGAFGNCSGLTSVRIPEGVTEIGESAFDGCGFLTSINIPTSVTSISNRTFMDCYSLTSIRIPEGVTSIGNYAFYGCRGLTSITIPSSVTSIGDKAFGSCNGLTSLTVENPSPITITSNTFSNRQNVTLYVPAGSKVVYEVADYWKEFKAIVEMDPPFPAIESFAVVLDGERQTLHGKLVTKDGLEYIITDSGVYLVTGRLERLAGDVNADGKITIADVMALVNVILGHTSAESATIYDVVHADGMLETLQ